MLPHMFHILTFSRLQQTFKSEQLGKLRKVFYVNNFCNFMELERLTLKTVSIKFLTYFMENWQSHEDFGELKPQSKLALHHLCKAPGK